MSWERCISTVRPSLPSWAMRLRRSASAANSSSNELKILVTSPRVTKLSISSELRRTRLRSSDWRVVCRVVSSWLTEVMSSAVGLSWKERPLR